MAKVGRPKNPPFVRPDYYPRLPIDIEKEWESLSKANESEFTEIFEFKSGYNPRCETARKRSLLAVIIRHGLDDGKCKTFEQMASWFGIKSSARMRLVYAKGMRILRSSVKLMGYAPSFFYSVIKSPSLWKKVF